MHRKSFSPPRCRALLLLSLGMLLSLSCSVQLPQLTFSAEESDLERETIGDYRLLRGEFSFLTLQEKTYRGERLTGEPARADVLQILAQQRARKTQLEKLERSGILGVDRYGFLHIIRPEALSPDERRLVQRENHSRDLLLGRLLWLCGEENEACLTEVRRQFAEWNQRRAPKGCRVQRADGSWIRK